MNKEKMQIQSILRKMYARYEDAYNEHDITKEQFSQRETALADVAEELDIPLY